MAGAKVVCGLDDIMNASVNGSGDKGTPVVLVQGYFDNYTN